MRLDELPTPAFVVDSDALDRNVAVMAAALPGARLRPHVKAHKCTSLARRQAAAGHERFTCATIRECEGMVAAGLGQDLMLANEVLDATRLGKLVEAGAGITLAVDSLPTVEAAVAGGVRDVVIDVNVGLPRCGVAPAEAGALAAAARQRGLRVRGVMGYEGHVVGLTDAAARAEKCAASMALLVQAHADVGGELISAGGTGTYTVNTWASEIQAGSYVLMDSAYSQLGLPFEQAAFVLASVISASPGWSVGDAGLKAFAMEKGPPQLLGGEVMFCSDEHVTFRPPRAVGGRAWLVPAHIDPTVACHERMYVYSGDEVIDIWPVDLRGW
jgi:D-serine deaminase-like pyridoxal phosphate-dependent protein